MPSHACRNGMQGRLWVERPDFLAISWSNQIWLLAISPFPLVSWTAQACAVPFHPRKTEWILIRMNGVPVFSTFCYKLEQLFAATSLYVNKWSSTKYSWLNVFSNPCSSRSWPSENTCCLLSVNNLWYGMDGPAQDVLQQLPLWGEALGMWTGACAGFSLITALIKSSRSVFFNVLI